MEFFHWTEWRKDQYPSGTVRFYFWEFLMNQRKRWQTYLVIVAVALTIYNILPTVFYYGRPLHDPINEPRAKKVAHQIVDRVESLEQGAVEWIESFCKLLDVKPLSVISGQHGGDLIEVRFSKEEEATKLRKYVQRAGSLIDFVPAQLALYGDGGQGKVALIQRRLPLRLTSDDAEKLFQYGTKTSADGKITDLYRGLIYDRVMELGVALGGEREMAEYIRAGAQHAGQPTGRDLLLLSAQNLVGVAKALGEESPAARRFYASCLQLEGADRASMLDGWIGGLQQVKDQLRLAEPKRSPHEEEMVNGAIGILRRERAAFLVGGEAPWEYGTVLQALKESGGRDVQTISLAGRSPFIASIVVDWAHDQVSLKIYDDLVNISGIEPWVYGEIATASRRSGEEIRPAPQGDGFLIELSKLQGSKSFLAFRLFNIAQAEAQRLQRIVSSEWMPQHPDLQRGVFPVWDYETYLKLPKSESRLGLVVFAPSMYAKMPPQGLKMNSVYVIAKGLDRIAQQHEGGRGGESFASDFRALRDLLQKNGFFGYSASAYGMGKEFAGDFIFEGADYFRTVLSATRENFGVFGTKRYAILEFTDVEQRIVTDNKIDTEIHESLLKWRDDYHASQVDLRGARRYDVPAPTKSPLWSNFKLSAVKYVRGDDRKILKWGLDMSGGKTVQIELRDAAGRTVTNEADLRQGINELFTRVNKMGVSEVNIRLEGTTIALDFPGSQSLSAADLVKASSMHFHVVNERFMTNPTLADTTSRFLQEVWNEAAVTGKHEASEVQAIACRHLYGENGNPELAYPRSESAKILYDSGLRLSIPGDVSVSSTFDPAFSKIAVFRGSDYTDWYGQTHPLLIVFRNYALEGSSLDHIQGSYDPSKGNFLGFTVKGSATQGDGMRVFPRDDLFAWTKEFSKETIAGTSLESLSSGRGWRMAVVLNGTVITAPALESPLRDTASITGSFTQREITKLEADLKAGSLSFTPRILSEKNVSPELGASERLHSVVAMVTALVLVILAMVSYYRFGGIVASVAVLFNLLIMWATLQNIGAALSLAGIAGVILTVAMAVDANVLVFERIREEFALTGRIASAVHAGYRKAFSAIIDSNCTTLIAALVLLNFDSGPIRGFALTLIIGIVSSLFSALFMTRVFFAYWVQDPEHRELKMANWIGKRSINFLKFTKPTLIVSAVVIAIGLSVLIGKRETVLGMDFTGGYALTVDLPQRPEGDYRAAVEQAVVQAGAKPQEVQIRELHPASQVRIFFSRSMEEKGHPFYGMPLETGLAEQNPRIVWTVQALQTAGMTLSPTARAELGHTWTAISGQMSETMRTNALIGIAIALACILVYITLRFEFTYAISATICLIHDVVFCLGIIALLHLMGVSIQIDLHTVAALMTIVGYSLNDTIIVFDRIREDIRMPGRRSLTDVINHALNVTLSRTLLTSGITLLVLLPLMILGGSTIFGFALVMAVGVVFGTLSSLFIAAPLMQYFHEREHKNHEGWGVNA
jgi:SecD/SecF fusion protein